MGGMTVLANHEAAPHVLSSVIVIAFASWQILRYLFFHPELTVYMLAMYPTKSWLTQHRYNERHPMDKPVFRWFQRVPEFYFYDNYRDFIKGHPGQRPVRRVHEVDRPRTRPHPVHGRQGLGEGGQGKI